MARFNLMILRIFVFVDILLISGTSASKCWNMPCGKLWIKTLGRGGGDWVERWSLGNNLVHFFEILCNFTNYEVQKNSDMFSSGRIQGYVLCITGSRASP